MRALYAYSVWCSEHSGWIPVLFHCRFDVSVNSWWRHQMETFCPLPALRVGNSPVTGEFPSQRPVTQSFDVFFDLRLNKRLSKQSRRQWFEAPSRSLWRNCNSIVCCYIVRNSPFCPWHRFKRLHSFGILLSAQDSLTVVLFTKIRNDSATERNTLWAKDFAVLEFNSLRPSDAYMRR